MTVADDTIQSRLALLIPINNLGLQQQEQMLNSAKLLEFKKKETIFTQGDRDNWSFYVTEGEIELYADDQLIKRVTGGEGASFHALAQLRPRQMSARAKTKAKVLRVNRGLLDRLLSVEERPVASQPDIEVTELEVSASGHWIAEMLQSDLFAHIQVKHCFRQSLRSSMRAPRRSNTSVDGSSPVKGGPVGSVCSSTRFSALNPPAR